MTYLPKNVKYNHTNPNVQILCRNSVQKNEYCLQLIY